MSGQLYTITSTCTDPYYNLALESCLLDQVQSGDVILYLWQNAQTVVCGRNQNVWKECHVSALLADGGHIARRLSGGGAVYHVLGNINFTFLTTREAYHVPRQLQVIVEACAAFGMQVEFSGRNDLLIGGSKFSGNAFYQNGDKRYHHGTLMLRVDFSRLSDYLNVDREKLTAKGVASVRARGANLADFCPEITIEGMAGQMRAAFGRVYGGPVQPLPPPDPQAPAFAGTIERFASDAWIYGRQIDFDTRVHRRFPWGDFDLNAVIRGGRIADAQIYSDALDERFIRELAAHLPGLPYSHAALAPAVRALAATEEQAAMARDIDGLLFASI